MKYLEFSGIGTHYSFGETLNIAKNKLAKKLKCRMFDLDNKNVKIRQMTKAEYLAACAAHKFNNQ